MRIDPALSLFHSGFRYFRCLRNFARPSRPSPLSRLLALAAVLGTVASPAVAQLSAFTHEGCAPLAAEDFVIDTLVRAATNPSVQEPLKMDFSRDAQGHVDVYFTQRYGRVLKYSGATGTTVTIADFAYDAAAVPAPNSNPSSTLGLHGIALDPAFRSNGWIYLYTTLGTGNSMWRVTRYKVNGDILDRNSGKVILEFSASSSSQHMGGVIRFDKDANLWVTVGDNGGNTLPSAFANANPYQAANTASPFGKILRVKPRALADDAPAPTPAAGATYDIPAGNLFLPGTPQTLPEIYVMGSRNPYTLALDSVRGAIGWGDVGPDALNGSPVPVASPDPARWTEEFNFTTTPGNFGWPYWTGNQLVVNTGGGTVAEPRNTRADNTGMTLLPPARPAFLPYGRDCAIAGDVYYYNGTLASDNKFPPHFHGAWLVGDFNKHWIDGVKLDAAGSAVQARARLFAGTGTDNLLRLPFLNNSSGSFLEQRFGPDGALYILNYNGYRTTTANTGLYRVRYRGSCRPGTASLAQDRAIRLAANYRLEGRVLVIGEAGVHTAEVRDVAGRVLWSRRGDGPARYDLAVFLAPARAPQGVGLLIVSGPSGRFTRVLLP